MTRDEFRSAAFILNGSWPGTFSDNDEAAYWHMLEDLPAAAVMRALKALRGQKFRPTPGEIAEALSEQAHVPTCDEMIAAIFGPGGVLAARPPQRGSAAATIAAWEAGEDPDTTPGAWPEAAFATATDTAQLARAAEQHPLIDSFVQRQGLPRLRTYNVDGKSLGAGEQRSDTWDRKELREAWAAHVEAQDGREVAALASGTSEGLRRMDPRLGLPSPTETEAA